MATAPAAARFAVLLQRPRSAEQQRTCEMEDADAIDNAKFMEGQHAVPLTIEEFVMASRHFPIIFSAGDNPVPLALMGMNEGVNVFMDDEGQFTNPVYVPAYIRRYPFMLAKLRPDGDELSLCFDPTSDAVGELKRR